MRIGSLEVTFHRTVRVADGRTPSNLPPSLGRMSLHPVKQYRKNCPESWDDDAFFMALHDVEAMWMSFHSSDYPVAALIGAGGVNALTGEKLGTVLVKDNYVVCPPQPWLDGWKDPDGTVFQFVATPHKKGDGITVAEQLIGKESKTGAIGIAVFEPKEPSKLVTHHSPSEWNTSAGYSTVQGWGSSGIYDPAFGDETMVTCSLAPSAPTGKGQSPSHSLLKSATPRADSAKRMRASSIQARAGSRPFAELGIGKGGKIIQKIYLDPHGLEVWKEKPSAVFAVYLVDAKTAEEITGEKVPSPKVHDSYSGVWFGLQDKELGDVAGSEKFAGLKSAAFTGDTSNVEDKTKDKKQPVTSEAVAAK